MTGVRGSFSKLVGASLLALTVACSGGGGTTSAPDPTPPAPPPSGATRLFEDPLPRFLSVSDVESVLSAAIAEADARGTPATISVVDRVGNVLAVYRMDGAPPTAKVTGAPSGRHAGLQTVEAPSNLVAIAKAITGAYLSSGGNAFSSRTASQIVQEHFPPAPGLTNGLESGPLFGVQISQLPCSDLNTRFNPVEGPFIGPQRSPLGLSADPGGFPLYKDGVVVGGIGVTADDTYTFDPDIRDIDQSDEEAIAFAATRLFPAPEDILADRILVDGTALRFSDATATDLLTDPAAAPAFLTLPAGTGELRPVRGYYGPGGVATILAGTTYGTERSGIRLSTEFNTPDAYVLSDGLGNNRYPPRAGTDGADIPDPLTEEEVRTLLEESFNILSQARAQIRRPLDSRAQVTVSIVDTNGEILGMVRSPDGPVFGTDVSLQKARTAAFFSGANAADNLNATPRPPALAPPAVPPGLSDQMAGNRPPGLDTVVDRTRTFLADPTALTGSFAFADRSGGNLSRPFFPDGEVGNGPGPFSVPIDDFNPFNTGLQTELVVSDIAGHVGFVLGLGPMDIPRRCTGLPTTSSGGNRLMNGMQIFPGSVPIYRGDQLIGGIGVSGDGIDQDDMISFLGLHNAGLKLGTINNAPPDIRADRIEVQLNGRTARLRYVNCPFTPFLDSDAQNVCQGK
ncbi:MAG: heme-binding protein [Pseudomonadota bacterium]